MGAFRGDGLWHLAVQRKRGIVGTFYGREKDFKGFGKGERARKRVSGRGRGGCRSLVWKRGTLRGFGKERD